MRRYVRKARRNKTRRGGQSTTTTSPLVARRRMDIAPRGIDTLDTRKSVLVEHNLARDNKSARGRDIDAGAGAGLRRPKADAETATIREVAVAIPASEWHKDAHKATKGPKVRHRGRSTRENEVRGQVATRGLRKTVEYPVGSLERPRMPRRPKIGMGK